MKTKMLLLLFCILLVSRIIPAFSQTPHIDSLLQKLSNMPDDTHKVNVLQEITKSYMVELNNPEKIAEYAEKGFKLSKRLNFKRGIGVGIFYKGFFYWSKGNYLAAIYHYKQALNIMKEVGNRRAISFCYLNIGQTYCDMGNYSEGLKYMFAGLKIKEELNDKIGLEIGYNNIGNIFLTQGNYTKALTYYLKTLKIAEGMNDKLIISYAYINIGTIFLSQNKHGEALVYFKKAAAIQETLGDKSGAGSSYTSIGNIYFSRKQYEDALIFHLKDFKAKESLEDRQGMAIASNNVGQDYFAMKKFRQSMTYQQKSFDLCNQIRTQNRLICAVADCTGHGVPGAFMSILGYNMMENTLKELPVLTPATTLNTLSREAVRLSGNQQEESRHGMDISLISIDPSMHQLEYAGAHNSIYIIRAGELIELKADKWGIGDPKKVDKQFSNQSFGLQKGDMIYLFTDGFPDQLGGDKRKKFFYPPFKELLTCISNLPMNDQKKRLEKVHQEWRSSKYEQTDDILIMGICYR